VSTGREDGASAAAAAAAGGGGAGGWGASSVSVEDEARRLAREETDTLMSPSAKSSPVKMIMRTKSIGAGLDAGSWSGR
jgi:hypothetical protein